MKANDLAELWARQEAERHGGNEAVREYWASGARRTVSDTMDRWGEAFVVFLGDRVGAVFGDAGAARHLATQARDVHKVPNVRIKRVRA